MRVVQTELTETEHALLEAYVRARRTTIKEAVREAIRTLTVKSTTSTCTGTDDDLR